MTRVHIVNVNELTFGQALHTKEEPSQIWAHRELHIQEDVPPYLL